MHLDYSTTPLQAPTFRGWGDRFGAGGGGGAARGAGGGGSICALTEAIQQGEVELMGVLLLVPSQ